MLSFLIFENDISENLAKVTRQNNTQGMSETANNPENNLNFMLSGKGDRKYYFYTPAQFGALN